jgi:hypothetical protein
MTLIVILNVVLAVFIVAAIVSLLGRGIVADRNAPRAAHGLRGDRVRAPRAARGLLGRGLVSGVRRSAPRQV